MHRSNRLSAACALCALLLIGSQSRAQSLSGRFSTSLYSWEYQDVDSTSSKFVRGYQTGSISVQRIANRNISVNSYFRTSYDLGDEINKNPQYWVYSLNAKWNDVRYKDHRFDFSLGRQTVYTGVLNPVIDGFRGDYSYAGRFRVMGFLGVLQPLDGSLKIDQWDESHAMGVRFSASDILGSTVALSVVEKSRDPVTPFYFSRDIGSTFLVTRNEVKEQLYGFDLNRVISPELTVYGHAEYERFSEEVTRVSSDFQYSPTANLFLALEYEYRQPRVFGHSIFSAFDLESNQEIWLRSRYRINRAWTAFAELATVLYEDDSAERFSLGCSYQRVSVTYHKRLGYGGSLDALTLSAYQPLTPKLQANASISYSSFKLNDDISTTRIVDAISRQRIGNSNYSFFALTRLTYKIASKFDIDTEAQFLSQNIKSSSVYAGNKYDFRFLLRTNYWIFTKF